MKRVLLYLTCGFLYLLTSWGPVRKVFMSETLSVILWTMVGILVVVSVGAGVYAEVKKRSGKG